MREEEAFTSADATVDDCRCPKSTDYIASFTSAFNANRTLPSMCHTTRRSFLTTTSSALNQMTLTRLTLLLLMVAGNSDGHPHSAPSSSYSSSMTSVTRVPVEFDNHHQKDEPAFRVFYGSGVSWPILIHQ